MKQEITVVLDIPTTHSAYRLKGGTYAALEHFFTFVGFKVEKISTGIDVDATFAVNWLCNKLRPASDRRILVAKGVDGDEELYTEICDDDDIPNIEDGTYHDFQIWE